VHTIIHAKLPLGIEDFCIPRLGTALRPSASRRPGTGHTGHTVSGRYYHLASTLSGEANSSLAEGRLLGCPVCLEVLQWFRDLVRSQCPCYHL